MSEPTIQTSVKVEDNELTIIVEEHPDNTDWISINDAKDITGNEIIFDKTLIPLIIKALERLKK